MGLSSEGASRVGWRRGESNFAFSVLTNSLTTLEESLALAVNFEETDSCGWSNAS